MPTKEEQKVIDEFDKMFPLQWFSTENYTGGANELEFSEWTERQLRLAKNRRETFLHFYLTALRNKEKEVWERVKECVPFSQMHTLPDGVNSRHETEYDRGWNKCRELTLANIKNLSK